MTDEKSEMPGSSIRWTTCTVVEKRSTNIAVVLEGQRSDGTWNAISERTTAHGSDVVGVIALDPIRDSILFVRQPRPGAFLSVSDGRLVEDLMFEIPAGIVDAGCTREEAARKELREEVGCTALTLQHVMTYTPDPELSSRTVTIFQATVDATQVSQHKMMPPEFLEVHEMPLSTALSNCLMPVYANAMTLIALLWLARTKEGPTNAN
jgi:ADP-ribose pyrophosphatase